MSYDEKLAIRVRKQLAHRKDVDERKMFGGLVFMVRSHMCCGVDHEKLMARVGPDYYGTALKRKHVKAFDIKTTPLTGFVLVEPAGIKTASQLRNWVGYCLDFVDSLPAKKPKIMRNVAAVRKPPAFRRPV